MIMCLVHVIESGRMLLCYSNVDFVLAERQLSCSTIILCSVASHMVCIYNIYYGMTPPHTSPLIIWVFPVKIYASLCQKCKVFIFHQKQTIFIFLFTELHTASILVIFVFWAKKFHHLEWPIASVLVFLVFLAKNYEFMRIMPNYSFLPKMAQLHFHVHTVTLHHPIDCSSVSDRNMRVNTKYTKF